MGIKKLEASVWTLFEKIAFRFFFIYFILFIAFENNGAYPYWGDIIKIPDQWMHKFIVWFGKNIIQVPYEFVPGFNGSGDTTYGFLLILFFAIVALFGTVIWSFLERKKVNYEKLYYWLTVALRFYVGFMLIGYGYAKLFKTQFPEPSLYRLMETYGESSPMGLAWAFLGFSKGYNIFMGIAEVSAGLLLFRRTLAIGSFITLATTANIVAVNYFYDVPVKITSTHLMLITLFLMSKNIKELFLFFFKNKSLALSIIKRPIIKKRWMRLSLGIFKYLLIGYVCIYRIPAYVRAQNSYGDDAPKPPMYGMYEISNFVINKDTLLPIRKDTIAWKYINMSYEGYFGYKRMDKKIKFYRSSIDTIKREIVITDQRDSTKVYNVDYHKSDADNYTFKMIIGTDTITAYTKRIFREEDFLLMNRGFRFISERPFNR